MGKVNVVYNDFSRDNTVVEKITFELLPSTILSLEEIDGEIEITMSDSSTDDVKLSGTFDSESLDNLIRSLSIFKSQIKHAPARE